jgi:hypothetical protein
LAAAFPARSRPWAGASVHGISLARGQSRAPMQNHSGPKTWRHGQKRRGSTWLLACLPCHAMLFLDNLPSNSCQVHLLLRTGPARAHYSLALDARASWDILEQPSSFPWAVCLSWAAGDPGGAGAPACFDHTVNARGRRAFLTGTHSLTRSLAIPCRPPPARLAHCVGGCVGAQLTS